MLDDTIPGIIINDNSDDGDTNKQPITIDTIDDGPDYFDYDKEK